MANRGGKAATAGPARVASSTRSTSSQETSGSTTGCRSKLSGNPRRVNATAWATCSPWESGVVTTYGHFEFDGGYVDVDMEAPAGAGMWPAIWLLPGPGCSCTTDNFEVDVQEGGFLSAHASAGQTYAWHLHDNVAGRTVGGVVATGQDLAAGFHHYGLLWVPGRALTWYFDGRQVAAVTRSTLPVPDEPMELVLSLGVAGTAASGWHSVISQQDAEPAVMRVASVSVFRTGPPPGGRH